NDVDVSQVSREQASQLSKDLVPLEMAKLIVDRLELVHVHKDERDRSRIAACATDLIGEPPHKVVTVVGLGQGIHGGLLLDFPGQPEVVDQERDDSRDVLEHILLPLVYHAGFIEEELFPRVRHHFANPQELAATLKGEEDLGLRLVESLEPLPNELRESI